MINPVILIDGDVYLPEIGASVRVFSLWPILTSMTTLVLKNLKWLIKSAEGKKILKGKCSFTLHFCLPNAFWMKVNLNLETLQKGFDLVIGFQN